MSWAPTAPTLAPSHLISSWWVLRQIMQSNRAVLQLLLPTQALIALPPCMHLQRDNAPALLPLDEGLRRQIALYPSMSPERREQLNNELLAIAAMATAGPPRTQTSAYVAARASGPRGR